MAVLGLCLLVLFACVIVSTPVVQGRSLRRHHGRHSHPSYYEGYPSLEESVPRDMSRRLEDDLEYGDSYSRRAERRGYPQAPDRSAEYEDAVEERVPSPRRHKHEYEELRDYEPSRRREAPRDYDDVYGTPSTGYFARRKRHNKHNGVSYKKFTEQDKLKEELMRSRQYDHDTQMQQSSSPHGSYELEVKEAQNSTICNYTVVSIPDKRGTRVPKDLEHIKCNHVGRSCQGAAGAYCCIQTYRYIEVSYGDGDREPMKVYVGCVCAHRFSGAQLTESPLPIDD